METNKAPEVRQDGEVTRLREAFAVIYHRVEQQVLREIQLSRDATPAPARTAPTDR
jgi:hypothetical protein